ncbi:MAG: molybdenum cofactor biosynthesis protein MoaE [Candidatus Omnitrophota bacterium]
MKFNLSSTPLEHLNLKQDLATDSSGALCCFEGIVRDRNDGRRVTALEYEAYPELCEKEMQKVFQEVNQKFKVIRVNCFHRTGRLKVGKMAVWVGVTSAHRDDAFKACRFVIDQLKERLPIWKKEYYVEGDSGWINTQKNEFPQGSVLSS